MSERMLMTRPLLEARHVSRRPDAFPPLENISLSVSRGTIVGLTGPRGAGKTALLRTIARHIPFDGGRIWFNGQDISRRGMVRVARLGLQYLFQRPRVFAGLSCLENMLTALPGCRQGLLALFSGISRAEHHRAARLLRLVGLHALRHAPAACLSPARKKLLELAMGLMSEPQLLLVDDPFHGVPPREHETMLNILRRANAELGIAFLIGGHDMELITALADYVYCLNHGAITAAGPPEDICRHQPETTATS